uniref:LRAT domain-containing protein n=1 Tax=Strongyloides venezuelensis TaxID=75913 RepID=A0A0K0EUY8_STRVS
MNGSIITPWTSAEKLVGKLEIVDLIEIRRRGNIGFPIYKHWAVIVGFRNGIHAIIHLSNRKNDCKPQPAMLIYYRVIIRLVSYGYSAHTDNCERFAK